MQFICVIYYIFCIRLLHTVRRMCRTKAEKIYLAAIVKMTGKIFINNKHCCSQNLRPCLLCPRCKRYSRRNFSGLKTMGMYIKRSKMSRPQGTVNHPAMVWFFRSPNPRHTIIIITGVAILLH